MAKKKLLVIGHSLVISVNRSPFRALAQLGDFETTLIAPSEFYGDLRKLKAEPELMESGVKLQTIPVFGSRLAQLFFYSPFKLAQIFREGRFDFVFSWQEPYVISGFQIAVLSRYCNVPMGFFTAQNIVKSYPPPFTWFERFVFGVSRLWVGAGRGVYDAMVLKGCPEKKGVIIPHAVDLDQFFPRSLEESENIKSKLGLHGKVITFMGRFVEAKGLKIAMAAIDALGERTDISVLFLGSGPLEKEMRNWAKAKAYPVKVLLATHEEVGKVLCVSRLLLAPSQTTPNWKEQFGRMIVESMASGVPVIGSNSGEIPNVVGDAGIILGERDINGWVRALALLLDNSDEHSRLRVLGLERARTFSSETVGRALNSTFLEAL